MSSSLNVVLVTIALTVAWGRLLYEGLAGAWQAGQTGVAIWLLTLFLVGTGALWAWVVDDEAGCLPSIVMGLGIGGVMVTGVAFDPAPEAARALTIPVGIAVVALTGSAVWAFLDRRRA